jgi:alpha-D-ribose 1-methylphosphonate 5-triphosphate synthase subunit PhnG
VNAYDRPAWLRVLALAPFDELAKLADVLAPLPPFTHAREPEIGLAMVRGRIGGDGAPVNVGEMTVTRCRLYVETAPGEQRTGFACVAGRSPRHAELIALCDAMLQSPHWHERVIATVVVPAERALHEKRERNARRRAATKADFVTVLRSGES